MSDEKEVVGNLSQFAFGPLFAFMMTVLRALYFHKKPWQRIILEGFIVSGLTVTAMAATFLFYPAAMKSAVETAFVAAGIGSFLGFIGVEHARRYAIKFLNLQTDK